MRGFTLLLLTMMGLEGCSSDGATTAAVPDLPAPTSKEIPAQPSHPARPEQDLPQQVYRRAAELARKEINRTNARNRLEQIDEQIEREKDMMR